MGVHHLGLGVEHDCPLMGAYQITRAWEGLDPKWMDLGVCAGSLADRSVFFADDERGLMGAMRVAEAKAHCVRCDVQVDCLNYALASKPQGIWGGLTEAERRTTIKTRAAANRAALRAAAASAS